MKRNLIFFLLLLLFGCGKSGTQFRYIEVTPSVQEINYGEDFHGVFLCSDPVYLTEILYSEEHREEIESKYISRTFYQYPPYEIEWEGVRVSVPNLQTIEVWIEADCRPTNSSRSTFALNLEPIRLWYDDEDHIMWHVQDVGIIRNKPSEEVSSHR